MERNINSVTMKVIKDADKVYPDGCDQSIPCKHDMLGDRTITTDIWNRTGSFEAAGLEVPAGTPADEIATAEVVKIKVDDGRGFLYIDRADYNANISQCNECCVQS